MMQEKISGFHCPRWEELPALGLYLDQVMIVLDDALGPIAAAPEKVITPTIINNYVKQKVLTPTEKKKYNRTQVADLMMISLLKRVLTTAELVLVLAELKKQREPQLAYDLFCIRLEQCLAEACHTQFSGTPVQECPPLVSAALRALAGKIVFELLLLDTQSDTPAKKKTGKPAD